MNKIKYLNLRQTITLILIGVLLVVTSILNPMLPLEGKVHAISDCDRIAIEKGSLFTDNDKCKTISNTCQPSGNGETSPAGEPGSLFIIGDSIGQGLTTPLGSALGTEWKVSGDTRVGRPLREGIGVANAKPAGLAEANYVLIVLGTNSLTNSTNAADIASMVSAVKAAAPSASIYWLKINVTRSDLVAGQKTFNEELGKAGISLLDNTATISGDGIHPANYTDLGKSVAEQLVGSASGSSDDIQVGNCVCSSDSSVELSGSDNKQKAYNYFISKGLTPFQAAAIVGNMQQESGVDPEKIQGGSRSKDPVEAGTKGWGLIQWTPGSRIIGIAQGAGITGPIYELGTQLDIVWWHMTNQTPTGVRNFIEGFKTTTTIEAATEDFERRMEGAGKPMLERRIQYAKDILKLYGGGGDSTGPPISTSDGDCSDISNPGENTKYVDGFLIYSQYDPAWKDKPYSSSTIGVSGCGPAAMAMIITALTGEKVTPVATAAYAAEKGQYVAGSGSKWSIGPVLAERWGLKATNIGVNAEKISQTLQAGGLVITAGAGAKPFTEGGHFLVIRGVTESGKFLVGDSGHSDTSDKEWDPAQLLESMRGRDGSVYAITK